MPRPDAPEFTHPIAVDKIAPSGMDIHLEAREKERRALAERFGLLDIAGLKADVTIHPERSDRAIEVSGHFTAAVVQSCVVTLEPLAATIDKDFATLFVAPDRVDPDDENMEALTDNYIDLGELVAQHLATSLDPYPRKPGLSFVEAEFGAPRQADNPFAKLAVIHGDKDKK